MKKHAAILRKLMPILLLGLLTIVWGLPAQALDVPRLQGHVNDDAGMLTSTSRRQLEAVLSDFERQESTQIVVLTIPSLKGDALEDFSMRVAEAWKIGQKGTDNGAILLVVKNDRKIRIEVGYGLEGRLTDLVAGRIIRNVITPYFRAGQFDQGITQGVGAMIEAVKGEFSAPATPSASQKKSQKGTPIFAVLGLLFLVNALGRVSRFMGAAAGAVLFPIAGALFFGAAPLLLLGLVPIGILAGLILSGVGGALSSGANNRIHRGGGGGYWGGGFGGGGGFSSGGFGGFSGGGGGFGGGGASGGW
ncbi:hypothetical protein JCM12296A_49200 [Desulfosarcina cetonica]|uniref:TPM domain-containing protein n=1 Tax=Desulfosarcina cetonica TaxID=90730 RepID=UPI000A6BB91C|nr:TPM domain-containing protein [Desulfosarcina cetonica]